MDAVDARFEPQTLAREGYELLREFRARFDLDEDYVLGVFDRGRGRVVGGTGLHRRGGEGALEIGYWVAADADRRRASRPRLRRC